MARDRFQFLKSFADSLRELAKADEWLAKDVAWEIINYWIYWENVSSENSIANALFIQMKLAIDKGQDISEKRRKANQQRTNIEQNLTKQEQNLTNDEQNDPKDKKEKIKDKKEKIKDKNNANTNISISKDIETEIEISDSSKSNVYWNEFINTLLVLIKEKCNELWIAYDKQKERQYWRLILTAKEFWEFADKIWQAREEFAINILIASAKIWFWKWICSGPMKIYQNYAEVYNLTVQQHNKNQKNLIQSF